MVSKRGFPSKRSNDSERFCMLWRRHAVSKPRIALIYLLPWDTIKWQDIFGNVALMTHTVFSHDAVIKWKHFPLHWPFVRGIHRSTVNSPHKGQWRGALIFSLICAWINGWVNNHEVGELRRQWVHYDVIVMRWWSEDMEEYIITYNTGNNGWN